MLGPHESVPDGPMDHCRSARLLARVFASFPGDRRFDHELYTLSQGEQGSDDRYRQQRG